MPMRSDEFIKIFYLSRRANISVTESFASAIADRLIDIFSLLCFWALTIALLPLPHWFYKSWLILLSIFLCVCLAIYLFFPKISCNISFFSKIWNYISPGIQIFPRGKKILIAITISLLEWFTSTLIIYIFLNGVFRLNIPISGAFFIIVGAYSCFALPLTPNGIGTLEFVIKYFLCTFYLVGSAEAVAFALLYRLLLIIPISIIGVAVIFVHFDLITKSFKESNND